MTRILAIFYAVAIPAAFLVGLVAGAWEPFVGAVVAGVFMVLLSAGLDSIDRAP